MEARNDGLTRRYLGAYPVVGGNRVQLLVDGAQTYPAMLAAIAQARQSILLESYIYNADSTGARFRDALVERAKAGVKVRVLLDGVGSMDTPLAFFQPLLDAGGIVRFFRPLTRIPWRWRLSIWKRDHRKLLIVDDQVGFIGGLNIGNEYAPAEWGGGAWHDQHAHLEGPAVRGLAQVFHRTWRHLTHEELALATPRRVGQVDVQILESLLSQRHSVRKAYLHAVRHAQHTVRITNAYCIPDRMVRRALRGACRRGVKVQMLLAGRSDVPAVQFASRALYSRLMHWGVEIYEWTDRVLHAKTAVIDGVWASIGSYNLDRRSLVHNLETNIACVDPNLGQALEREFEADLARSKRIDPATWHRRGAVQKLLEVFFYHLRYLL